MKITIFTVDDTDRIELINLNLIYTSINTRTRKKGSEEEKNGNISWLVNVFDDDDDDGGGVANRDCQARSK